MSEIRTFRITLPYAEYLVKVCGTTIEDAPLAVAKAVGKTLTQLSDEVHAEGGSIVLVLQAQT